MQTCVKQKTHRTPQIDVILRRIGGNNLKDRDYITGARISSQEIQKKHKTLFIGGLVITRFRQKHENGVFV